MRTRIFALALLPALLPTLICTAPSLAADATSFDPTKVQITAKATSSIPVGTVVTWPSGANPDMQNPDGTYNWLECNGQSISQTVYPELFAVIGGKVPDYRGLFLRGQGGNSEALGTVQNYAMPESYGKGWFVGGAGRHWRRSEYGRWKDVLGEKHLVLLRRGRKWLAGCNF